MMACWTSRIRKASPTIRIPGFAGLVLFCLASGVKFAPAGGLLRTLKGKHALVTGSSRGIGRGIALKLAERGANVAVHYYRNEDAAKATLAKIREYGSDGFLIQADVCHPEEVSRIFKQVAT